MIIERSKKMRTVSWFSCGAASAVATKLALKENPDTIVVYCEVKEEHKDNKRFLKDCEEWFGKKIIVLGNDEYKRSIYEVFWKSKYMSGVLGAPCTGKLKKSLRLDFEEPDDKQVFGYTCEEVGRVERFKNGNPLIDIVTPLIDSGLTKSDVLAIVQDAGIELPEMYKLGYKNNNCMGCVKAASVGYWKKIQIDFPKMFNKAAGMELITGCKLCKYTVDGEEFRVSLLELPEHIKPMDDTIDIQCGIFCEIAEDIINE